MEFEPTIGKQFLYEYLSNKEDIIFTFVISETFDMAHNWYLHLKKINLQEYSFLICLDEESYNKCKQLNLPSVLYKTNIKGEFSLSQSDISIIFNIMNFMYNTYKKNILFANTDIIFLKNPFQKLKSDLFNYDIGMIKNKLCKALSFINNNNFSLEDIWYKQSLKFFYLKYNKSIAHTFLNFMNDYLIDVFNNTIIKTKYLNSYEFPSIYYITGNDFLKQKILDICYILSYEIKTDTNYMLNYGYMVDENNNEVSHLEFKKILMKQNNHWLL